jgi:hypothetical protein
MISPYIVRYIYSKADATGRVLKSHQSSDDISTTGGSWRRRTDAARVQRSWSRRFVFKRRAV